MSPMYKTYLQSSRNFQFSPIFFGCDFSLSTVAVVVVVPVAGAVALLMPLIVRRRLTFSFDSFRREGEMNHVYL